MGPRPSWLVLCTGTISFVRTYCVLMKPASFKGLYLTVIYLFKLSSRFFSLEEFFVAIYMHVSCVKIRG